MNWKEEAAKFEAASRYFPGGTEESHSKHARITKLLAIT
jgi:hypothetical protein